MDESESDSDSGRESDHNLGDGKEAAAVTLEPCKRERTDAALVNYAAKKGKTIVPLLGPPSTHGGTTSANTALGPVFNTSGNSNDKKAVGTEGSSSSAALALISPPSPAATNRSLEDNEGEHAVDAEQLAKDWAAACAAAKAAAAEHAASQKAVAEKAAASQKAAAAVEAMRLVMAADLEAMRRTAAEQRVAAETVRVEAEHAVAQRVADDMVEAERVAAFAVAAERAAALRATERASAEQAVAVAVESAEKAAAMEAQLQAKIDGLAAGGGA